MGAAVARDGNTHREQCAEGTTHLEGGREGGKAHTTTVRSSLMLSVPISLTGLCAGSLSALPGDL